MISNKDNAVYIENITEQDNEDTDWNIEKNTTIQYKPKEIPLESDTTSTALTTSTKVSKNDEIKLIDNGNIINTALNSISADLGTVNIFDIFKDGSCTARYNLDGNVKDLGGNYNGSWSSNEQYDIGKFNQGAKVDGSNYIQATLPNFNDIMSNFFWVKLDTAVNAGISQITNSPKSSYHMGFYTDAKSELCFYLYAGACIYVDLGTKVNSNVFYLLGFVRNDTNKQTYIYLNGNLLKTITYNSSLFPGCNIINYGYFKHKKTYCTGVIDQISIFNKALTANEVTTLYTEQMTKYTVDVTSLNLSNTPTKAFFNNDITTTICVEETKNRVINEPLIPLIIDSSTATDGSNLVTPTKIYNNEEIIINDITAKAGTITFDSDTNLYTILLSNHNLTSKPLKAYKKGRISLTKVSSTTTQFVGTSENNELLQIADIVLLDGSNEVIISNISETTDDNNITTYTIGFDTQSVAPTTCEILSRDTVLQKFTETYDSSNNIFNVVYKDINLQGRAINRKIQAQKVDTTVVEPLQTELYKKG